MVKIVVVLACLILISAAMRCPDGYGGKGCKVKCADPYKTCSDAKSCYICADYA